MQADHQDDPGLDFPGFGPHSLRRVNSTWRQEIGSNPETGIIVGHSDLVPPRNTRKVPLKQQEELTLRVQAKRARAGKKSRSMRRRWRMGFGGRKLDGNNNCRLRARALSPMVSVGWVSRHNRMYDSSCSQCYADTPLSRGQST
jgi:hypothetical protein